DGTLISAVGRKVKHRDRSKDRLKYKNISEEFDEENMMVLPIKQFSHSKKDKLAKKTKKHEKLEKKQVDVKEKKHEIKELKVKEHRIRDKKHHEKHEKKYEGKEKNYDKLDKKHHEKPEKKVEKLDRNVSYESAGISNMSFEDFSMEDSKRDGNRSSNSLQSPEEEDTDLRMTGGTRFGSLKRGINPFSKLGR
ncbi:unnamed protein product, partial [Meganyctiphanes norvegica]